MKIQKYSHMPPYMMYRELFPRAYNQLRTKTEKKNHKEIVEFLILSLSFWNGTHYAILIQNSRRKKTLS